MNFKMVNTESRSLASYFCLICIRGDVVSIECETIGLLLVIFTKNNAPDPSFFRSTPKIINLPPQVFVRGARCETRFGHCDAVM